MKKEIAEALLKRCEQLTVKYTGGLPKEPTRQAEWFACFMKTALRMEDGTIWVLDASERKEYYIKPKETNASPP